MPLGAIKYLLSAAVMVISAFFAFKCLLSRDDQREIWRSSLKRRIYLSQKTFRRVTLSAGWIFLFIALFVAYLEIIALIES
jgi:hypothetical protein